VRDRQRCVLSPQHFAVRRASSATTLLRDRCFANALTFVNRVDAASTRLDRRRHAMQAKGFEMLIGQVCQRNVVCASRDTTVAAAAKLMRQHHVGDVVVVDRLDDERMPMGIVTDRDIVMEVVAPEVDPAAVTLGDLVPWNELATVQETDTCAETLRRMHDRGVRRMPVINTAGVLVELADVALRGSQHERQTRVVPIGSRLRSETTK
jgi:CBS domain-containing protein